MESKLAIYNRVKQEQLSINYIYEVGVYLPETSNVLDFIKDGINTTLIEPIPATLEKIHKYFESNSNVNIEPYAVYDHNGTIQLSISDASTFVSELDSSPALVNDKFDKITAKNIEVECRKFSELDNGKIDLLSIDTEGCEWIVLRDMISRPKIICLETHGKYYINKNLKEILNWMEVNNYVLWFKDGSDSVFIQDELFPLNIQDYFRLAIQELKNSTIRMKRFLKK